MLLTCDNPNLGNSILNAGLARISTRNTLVSSVGLTNISSNGCVFDFDMKSLRAFKEAFTSDIVERLDVKFKLTLDLDEFIAMNHNKDVTINYVTDELHRYRVGNHIVIRNANLHNEDLEFKNLKFSHVLSILQLIEDSTIESRVKAWFKNLFSKNRRKK